MPTERRPAPLEDVYLDFYACADELQRMGFGPFSYRQVRRMADKGRLPFFKAMDGRRYISKSCLHETMRQRQNEARKEKTINAGTRKA